MLKADEFAERIMGDLHDANVAPSDEIEEIIQKHVRDAMREVLYNYAWHKDGTMYVGCGIKTYKDAEEQL